MAKTGIQQLLNKVQDARGQKQGRSSNLGVAVDLIKNIFGGRKVGDQVVPEDSAPLEAVRRGSRKDSLSGLMEPHKEQLGETVKEWTANTFEDALGMDSKAARQKAANWQGIIRPLMLKWSGYGQAMGEMERMASQFGYTDPKQVGEEGREAQQNRNQKVNAITEGVYEYIKPGKEQVKHQGLKPGDVVRELTQHRNLISDLMEDNELEQDGQLTSKGEEKLNKRLENLTTGMQRLKDTTGAQTFQQAKQIGSKILGTSDPVGLYSNPEIRKSFDDVYQKARGLNLNQRDTIGLLEQTGERIKNAQSMQDYKNIASEANIAMDVVNEAMENGKIKTPEQKKQFFKQAFKNIGNRQKRFATRLETAAGALLQQQGYSVDRAGEINENLIERSEDPDDFLEKFNNLPSFGMNRPELSRDNMDKFLQIGQNKLTPEAERYMKSPAAARHAQEWTAKRMGDYRNAYLESEGVDPDYVEQFTSDKGILGDETIKDIANYRAFNSSQNRSDILHKYRTAQNKALNRSNMDNLRVASAYSNLSTPERAKGMAERARQIRNQVSPQRQDSFGESELNAVGSGEDFTLGSKFNNWIGKLDELELPKSLKN